MKTYELELLDGEWQLGLSIDGNFTVIKNFSSIEGSLTYLKTLEGKFKVLDIDLVGIATFENGEVVSVHLSL